MGEMIRLDSRGHGTIAKWADAKGAAAAKAIFDKHVAMGFSMFRIDAPGETSQLKAFDPAAVAIVAVPRFVGG